MRTQQEHNTAVRLSISCPSAEKTDSQIHRLKETDLSQKGPRCYKWVTVFYIVFALLDKSFDHWVLPKN